MKNEKIALTLKHLVVKHGDGCELCNNDESVLERNRCPHCKTVWAARDVSLQVYQGEILGVVGESGSGKSTLMKSLYMDMEPTQGEYFLDCYEQGEKNIFELSPDSVWCPADIPQVPPPLLRWSQDERTSDRARGTV